MSAPCFDNEQLQQIINGTCAPQQQSQCEQHLQACVECRQALESLAGKLTVPQRTIAPHSPALSSVMLQLDRLDQLSTLLAQDGPTEGADCRKPVSSILPAENELGSLGKYLLLKIQGRGGMGVVYAALDTTLGRQVAIKVPSKSLITDPDARLRFMREARSIAALKHDNIVTVHTVEQLKDTIILVMELVDGQSLQEQLSRESRLPWEVVAQIGTDVAAALKAAHSLGVVHRDIKPANILVEKGSGRAKVSDFGLAKSALDPSLTSSGVLVGTPEFMSPEQATHGTADPASDLFSLGTVLYYACTGHSPFVGATALASLQRVVHESPIPLREFDHQIPQWFSDLIESMMEKDHHRRTQSATEVHRILIGRGSEPTLLVPNPPPAPSHRWSVAGGLLAVLMVVGLLATAPWLFPSKSAAPRPPFTVMESGAGHDRLQDAIAALPEGGVVEVQEDGPFRVAGFDLADRPFTLRAAAGSHPVFIPEEAIAARPFLSSRGGIRLEGIEVRWELPAREFTKLQEVLEHCALTVVNGDLSVKNCRIFAGPGGGCVGCRSGSLEIVNSHLSAPTGPGSIWVPIDNGSLSATNSVWQGDRAAIVLIPQGTQTNQSAHLTLVRNSFATRWVVATTIEQPMRTVRVTVNQNACDVDLMLLATRGESFEGVLTFNETGRRLLTHLAWSGSRNAYRTGMDYMGRGLPLLSNTVRPSPVSFQNWVRAWDGTASGSFEVGFANLADPELERRFPGLRTPTGEMRQQVGADLSQVGPPGQ